MENQNKIKPGEKIAFAIGEVYGSGGVAILSLLYLFFLTTVLHIDPAPAGTVIMLARIWDAISDPLMGTISDNTRTKLGRRRPYIIASSGLIIVALFLLFMPIQSWESQAGKIAYVAFAHIFYSTVSTIFNVPYLSLTSEISQDTNERSIMNFVRIALGMISTGIVYIIVSVLKGQLHETLTETQFSIIVAVIFSVMFSVPVLITGLCTKERTPLPSAKTSFSFKTFSNTFKLKCFRRLLGMYVFSFVCNEIIANVILTYVFNVANPQNLEEFSNLPLAVNMALLLGAGVILPVALIMLKKKIAKPVIFMCGVPVFLLGAIGLATFPSGAHHPWLMIIPAAIAGLGFGMAQIIPWILFPDIVDVAELKSNDRNPGAYNGTMTFFKKFASGVAVFLIGLVLQATGFDSTKNSNEPQPESAITGIRWILGICISLFLIIAFIAAYSIKITTKKSERITYFIQKQRAEELDTLSDEEKAELDKLKEELF